MALSSSRREFLEYRRQRKARRRRAERADGDERHPRPSLALIGRLFALLKGQWLMLGLALVLLTLSTGLALVPACATKAIVDYVFNDRPLPKAWPIWLPKPGDREQLLCWIAATVLAVSMVEVCIRLWSRWCINKAELAAQNVIRRKAFEHALRLPLHKIYHLKTGGAASIMRDDAGRIAELIRTVFYNPWRAIIQLAASLFALFYIDWRLVLGAATVLPLVYLNHRSWHRRIRPMYRDLSAHRQAIDAHVTEAFGGMRVVRAFGRVRREAVRFARANNLTMRMELNLFGARSLESMWEVMTVGATAAMMLYGGSRVIRGELTMGDLTMFMSFLLMLLGPLEMLANCSNELQPHLARFERLLELLDEPQETSFRPGMVHVRRETVQGRLTLSNVSFRYPEGTQHAVSQIDLEVEPGETVALVGRSGAGKTTLSNLVARFYDPTVGAVELDGRDLRDIHPDSYRKLLGIVEQDVFLFDGTIAENIGYAVPRANTLEIERAARAAHVHEFVRQMERGYDTLIGERGVRLSGGQRQRLAIARALLADPRILIFDEATSNLDSESEQFIQQSLERLRRGRTCFIIAHRLSTIRRADRIVVMEAGQIVEIGTHDELFASDGRYRQMVEVQTLRHQPLVHVA